MSRNVFGLLAGAVLMAVAGGAQAQDAALKAAVESPSRPPAQVARDGARHPAESLAFWGLKPGQTVVEIMPGDGYWTEILAPYAKATGGKYVTTGADLSDPATSANARRNREDFAAKYADTAKYGQVTLVDFGAKSGPLGPPGSADLVLTARNIHNWMWQPGMLDRTLANFNAVLKPGGILAVEEHRADPRPQVEGAKDGYVSVANVVAAAEKAGFKLEAQSEINANPKDTKDHPLGVWTLPPNLRQPAPDKPIQGFDPAKYKAIGESDRMTLRFRKAG
jgi:predicted methyltransferase